MVKKGMAKIEVEKPEERYLETLREIRKLQKQLQSDGEGKQAAIDKLLGQRASIDEDLALLGHQAQQNAPGRPKATKVGKSTVKVASGPSSNYDEKKKCALCDSLGHDQRAHRSQEPKAKFAEEELVTRGLQKP